MLLLPQRLRDRCPHLLRRRSRDWPIALGSLLYRCPGHRRGRRMPSMSAAIRSRRLSWYQATWYSSRPTRQGRLMSASILGMAISSMRPRAAASRLRPCTAPTGVPATSARVVSCKQNILMFGRRTPPPFLPHNEKGAVSRKYFRADSPVFFDLNHGHLTLAIIMA